MEPFASLYRLVLLFVIWLHKQLYQSSRLKIERGPNFSNDMIVLGDSVAWGTGDDRTLLSPWGVARYFTKRLAFNRSIKQTWSVWVFGRDGALSRDWLPASAKRDGQGKTLFERLVQRPVAASAKIVLVFIGFDDARFAAGCSQDRAGVSAAETVANLRATTQVLVNMGKRVYICPVPNHSDHLVGPDTYGENMERNDGIKALVKSFQDLDHPVFLGPDCSNVNYEYKGEFLRSSDKQHFGARGYDKLARDFEELLVNEMIKIEFAKFKVHLGLSETPRVGQ
ncbi:hypothetical protein HDV03_002326 [Kappamyces sp. JEL0829]|nr:hypothetical protein HDV03_002326 [Kappamyces sp. JEL0829]